MDDDPNLVGAHCPTCGAEYRPGFDVCADDGTTLVAGPAPERPPEIEPSPEPFLGPAAETPSSPWVVAAEFGAQEPARLLAGRLEAEGIPTLLEPEWASTHYGPSTSAFLGRPFAVLVPEDRLEDARALIREIEAG